MLYTKGLSPFFLLKPFLTVGVGMKVCLVSLVSSEFLDKFNISLSCVLRGVVSLGESTGTSSGDFSAVPLSSFPYWKQKNLFLAEQQVGLSTSHS